MSFQAFAAADLSLININELNQDNKSLNGGGVSLGHYGKYRFREFRSSTDIDLRYLNHKKNIEWEISELYTSVKSKKASVAIGRKRLSWFSQEDFWLLGQLSGRRNFDLLDEKSNGHWGLHFKGRQGALHFKFFVSYLYQPERNPGLDIEDGKVVTNSYWESLPPTRTTILGRVIPIHYTLEMDKWYKYALKKSLGLSLGHKGKDYGVDAFVIYKPEPRIRINAEAYYDGAIDRVVVNASPIVNHHMVYGLNSYLGKKNGRLSLGFLLVDPQASYGQDFSILDPLQLKESNRTFLSDYFKIEPRYEKEVIGSLNFQGHRKDFSYEFGLIKYFTDHELGTDDFYSNLIKWDTAVGGKLSWKPGRQFSMSGSYRFDLVKNDQLLNASMRIRLAQGWHTGVELGMIKAPRSSSYWSNYRTQDYLKAKLNYSF